MGTQKDEGRRWVMGGGLWWGQNHCGCGPPGWALLSCSAALCRGPSVCKQRRV